jgi:hypothetical protein
LIFEELFDDLAMLHLPAYKGQSRGGTDSYTLTAVVAEVAGDAYVVAAVWICGQSILRTGTYTVAAAYAF